MVSPNDPDPYISELVEEVLGVLEARGVPQSVNDEVCKLLEAWEQSECRRMLDAIEDNTPREPEGEDVTLFCNCECGCQEARVTGFECGKPIEAECCRCGANLTVTDE